ncbi:hypothetical protein BST61_g340 [Cercospora zeina]
MRLSAMLLPLLASCTRLTLACPSIEGETRAVESLKKRWFGVPELPIDGSPVAPYRYRWPVTGTDPMMMPVRYCFKDKRSAKNLGKIVLRAIAGWSPSWTDGKNYLSALRIISDPGCGSEKYCLCSNPNVARDALVISDETRDNDHKWNDGPECQTISTTGYSYISASTSAPFRHYLKFCSYDPTDKNRVEAKAIVYMMHELGHIIGLSHEHQKANRDQYLWYQIKNLRGYDEATRKVTLDERGYFEDDQTIDQRVKIAARRGHIAQHYFPEAVDYAMSSSFAEGHDEAAAMWQALEASATFDYESIMIYSSDTGAIEPGKRVIFRRDNNRSVYMGGHPDAEKAGISEGDVARVAQLYDAKTEAGERAKNVQVWGSIGTGPDQLRMNGGREKIADMRALEMRTEAA